MTAVRAARLAASQAVWQRGRAGSGAGARGHVPYYQCMGRENLVPRDSATGFPCPCPHAEGGLGNKVPDPTLPCRCKLFAKFFVFFWGLGFSCTLRDFTNLP